MNERHPPIIKHYTFGNLTFRVETPVPIRENARFEAFSSSRRIHPITSYLSVIFGPISAPRMPGL